LRRALALVDQCKIGSSAPSVAEVRERRGHKHCCLLAFVSHEPLFELMIRFRLTTFHALESIAQNLNFTFLFFAFSFRSSDLLLDRHKKWYAFAA
jgi:hypothetical protein